MRTQPDAVDNMFGALTYFAMPKSFLEKNVGMYLLIKDEQEASLTSMPKAIVGFSELAQDSDVKNLGMKLQDALFEPGHPRVSVPIKIDFGVEGASALKISDDQNSQVTFEVSCHPEMLVVDSSSKSDPNMPEIRPGTASLDQMLQGDAEDLKDREKWQLLTRELV
jgi:hypothetical protein